MTGPGILDGCRHRRSIGEHDGRSGATLEHAVLADGRRVVVKRFRPDQDVTMLLTGDRTGREYRLWRDGVLDRLPPGVGHAVLTGWQDAGETVLVMRDLGDAVIGWDRVLTRGEVRRILGALAGVHRAFAGGPAPDGLCALEHRVAMLRPSSVHGIAGTSPLAGPVLAGWDRFADLAPRDVAGAVLRLLDDPAPLVAALAARPSSLLHGDAWFVNAALEPDRVTLIDWAIATWAPPALECTTFMVGAMSNVEASHDEILDDFRELSGDAHDEVALRLAFLATLCDFGWNKALDAAEHPDPAKRSAEAAELAWWCARARETLDAGLVEVG